MPKFSHSDKDILLKSPRSVELVDGSRVLFTALNIQKMNIFLDYLLTKCNEGNWLAKLCKLHPSKRRVEDFLFNTLSVRFVQGGTGYYSVFAPNDIVSSYWSLLEGKQSILPVDKCVEAFFTIIEQNNLLNLLSGFFREEKKEQKKKKQNYSNSFYISQIIKLGLVDGLTLANWDEKLTYAQRDLYLRIFKEYENKQIENNYVSVFFAIQNGAMGAKLELDEVLFPEPTLNPKEHARKNILLANKKPYTGDPGLDDKEIEKILESNPKLPKAFFL